MNKNEYKWSTFLTWVIKIPTESIQVAVKQILKDGILLSTGLPKIQYLTLIISVLSHYCEVQYQEEKHCTIYLM